MTRVKICGITRTEDLRAAVDSGADAVGVVSGVTVDTPREVDRERAAELVEQVPPFVDSALVTMPESGQKAARQYEAIEPDAVQVHGTLSPTEVGAFSHRVDADVIAAVDADDPDEDLQAYAAVADALLVDSTDEAGGGGTGRTHDWERTREIVELVSSDETETPVILAGGLTPENVAGAVETVGPYAVDVATGVEREGGLKDHAAVREFVAAAKSGDRE
ncbi:MAG: phosphoribosylanthranilate isomerase [Haloarculaceae archaeon]